MDTTQETKEALEKIINVLNCHVPTHYQQESKCIKYKPNNSQQCKFKERIIRMLGMPVDPLDPPKFKYKKVPRAYGSPPVPLVHSPPHPVTVKDQQDWKIPPCISNWKNPKGYTIPLDRRLASDGRGLQEVHVNDNFSQLSEALYVAEDAARKSVAMRLKVQKEIMLKDKEKKEMELRELAWKARSERSTACPTNDMISNNVDYDGSREDRIQRKKTCEQLRRGRRLEAAMGGTKKRKITRDRNRDISEKVALGMASTSVMMYDHRLFNQEKGVASGFASTDDAYDIYDKGLFTAHQPTLSTLCRPKIDVDSDIYGGGADEKIIKTDRFKPDTAFVGTPEGEGPRDRPVEFDSDPFGLNQNLRKLVGPARWFNIQ